MCFGTFRGICINIIEPHAHGADVSLDAKSMRPKTRLQSLGDAVGVSYGIYSSPGVFICLIY